MFLKTNLTILSLSLAFMLVLPGPGLLLAEDAIEKAGVGVELTVGNIIFLPAKAVSTSIGLTSGALSFLLSGGNWDLTRQMWQDTTQGPYLITPELAKKSIGDRPELREKQ